MATSTGNSTSAARTRAASRRSRAPKDSVAGAGAAAEAATDDVVQVGVPGFGRLHLPTGPHLAFYGGVGLLCLLEVVEWPVALLLAVGKALSDSRSSESLREFGNALESA